MSRPLRRNAVSTPALTGLGRLTPEQRALLADWLPGAEVIADLSCDIGGPIDSTLRASTIADPFFGYAPGSGKECPVGTAGSITVMSVDNLPCELPRDASKSFGRDLMDHVLPNLIGEDSGDMIGRATIARNGQLTARYSHLQDYAMTTA